MELFKRGVEVKHEVFFEKDLTSLRGRELFIGGTYPKWRYLVGAFVTLSVLIILVSRSFWMQVVSGERYQTQSENNRLKKQTLFAKRGIIKDAQGIVLAENIPSFQVTVTPTRLPLQQELAEEQIAKVARVLGISSKEIEEYASSTSKVFNESVIIAEDVSYERAIAFEIEQPLLPAFELQVAPRRTYPMSKKIPSLSHVLGYVGNISEKELETKREDGYTRIDGIGKTGLEKIYEETLKGVKGYTLSEVDSRGRTGVLVGETLPKDGDELVLSIDLRLQESAEIALREQMLRAKTERGAVIAMDPRDGSIKALVSLPAYDNNVFAGKVSSTIYKALLDDSSRPLFARAWQGSYPSGSTVKIVVSAAALAERIITPQTTVLSSGGIRIGEWFFPDWKAGGHGVVTVRSAIAWSVNTFYYTVGGGYGDIAGLGVEKLTEWMKKFGLSAPTGIDLTGEANGFVPSQEWKKKEKGERWYVGDTYNLSIGQGDLLVTPVQVAEYTASIANGGFRVKPHVKKDVEGETRSTERLADESVIITVQNGMRDCVVFGSCRRLSTLPFQAAGKTGTAQWATDKPYHAWFTSFAPFESPEIVVTVLLEEGGEGSSFAVPVAETVLKKWWEIR